MGNRSAIVRKAWKGATRSGLRAFISKGKASL